jgi:hypothetical protein
MPCGWNVVNLNVFQYIGSGFRIAAADVIFSDAMPWVGLDQASGLLNPPSPEYGVDHKACQIEILPNIPLTAGLNFLAAGFNLNGYL